ncbi:stanniocalcin 1, like [Melanotaenia boesemani]|uniref:stanniocalcin 1, like n=1 Tax=Melanotaenia boesemani TaxID=1250792 RepID=UPI001C03ECC5|nr:stanniocalcin 1, like [Melanotaenia boesemani]XP_041826259.1 stanniocalcin 1, like [Melanotaenia boesemani]
MLRGSALLLLLALSSTFSFELLPEEAAPRRARFSANSPSDVARCLSESVGVGCGFFSCLENSTCDTDGMHELCELFLHTAASFNTEGKTFVKKSLHCISQGISSKVFQTVRRCNIFQRMIAEVQEECYTSLDICTVARTNPDSIGEVVQVPAHFPNRYYSTLLQTLQTCDEPTVEVVRVGITARLGPDMETFLQLIQNKPCTRSSDSSAYSNPSSWRNMPVFNVQPGFTGRDPTHLFARKRSVDNQEREAADKTDK